MLEILMKTDDVIVVRTYATQQAADMAVLELESSGIEASVVTDNAGCSVLVAKSREAEARAVLEKMANEEVEVSARGRAPVKSKSFPSFAFGVLAGLVLASLGWWANVHRYDNATINVYDKAGRIQQTWYYQDGEVVKNEADRNGDGETDKWSIFHSGILKDKWFDEDMDGTFDVKKSFDPMGREISITKLNKPPRDQ